MWIISRYLIHYPLIFKFKDSRSITNSGCRRGRLRVGWWYNRRTQYAPANTHEITFHILVKMISTKVEDVFTRGISQMSMPTDLWYAMAAQLFLAKRIRSQFGATCFASLQCVMRLSWRIVALSFHWPLRSAAAETNAGAGALTILVTKSPIGCEH